MLYVVATPIGNLKDLSYRAVEVLGQCERIYAEDTSKSIHLLKEYEISAPCYSYHKFNEMKKLEPILAELESGQTIGLISDAGTPGICDPGARLIKACHERGIEVTSIPGACALSVAASLSGSEQPFQFLGFVPKKGKKGFLQKMKQFDGNSFAYETPHQIEDTLKQLGHVEVMVFRELTKMYEEIVSGYADEITVTAKGEMVLMVKGNPKESVNVDAIYTKLTYEYGLSNSRAVKLMAELYDLNKNELYSRFS